MGQRAKIEKFITGLFAPQACMFVEDLFSSIGEDDVIQDEAVAAELRSDSKDVKYDDDNVSFPDKETAASNTVTAKFGILRLCLGFFYFLFSLPSYFGLTANVYSRWASSNWQDF